MGYPHFFDGRKHSGKQPTHPENIMIKLMQKIGYRKGLVQKVGYYFGRGVYRAIANTGDFYATCVWGPFKDSHRKVGPYEMDISFPNWKVDIEIDGPLHKQPDARERDRVRDWRLRDAGWYVVRIPAEAVYRIFAPELDKRGVKYK